jgi:hypothetical protein
MAYVTMGQVGPLAATQQMGPLIRYITSMLQVGSLYTSDVGLGLYVQRNTTQLMPKDDITDITKYRTGCSQAVYIPWTINGLARPTRLLIFPVRAFNRGFD